MIFFALRFVSMVAGVRVATLVCCMAVAMFSSVMLNVHRIYVAGGRGC